MAEDDYSAVPAEGTVVRSRGGKHRGPRFTWNPAFEQTFFRSLCESVTLGLREGSTFKAEAWDRAGQALIDRHSAYPNKSHLINKSDNARKKFRLWRSLREDPDFLYNPSTRTVTGTEEAWKRHIEKEPLSRSLKGRPFEHEDFYEVLFPDVIGSGGAPKRVIRTRRNPNNPNGAEEQEPPGTAILDLLADATYGNAPAASAQQPRAAAPTSNVAPSPVTATTTTNNANQNNTTNNNAQRPTSTTLPPRTSIASTSALTPPEETTPHTRKRFAAADGATGTSQNGGYEKRRRTDPLQVHPPAWAAAAAAAAASSSSGAGASQDAIAALAEAIMSSKARPGWAEQALDLFFRDFGEEDMDLQLKIAEKALTDENKAMVFCKMPVALRRHWVRRLREVHNRSA